MQRRTELHHSRILLLVFFDKDTHTSSSSIDASISLHSSSPTTRLRSRPKSSSLQLSQTSTESILMVRKRDYCGKTTSRNDTSRSYILPIFFLPTFVTIKQSCLSKSIIRLSFSTFKARNETVRARICIHTR